MTNKRKKGLASTRALRRLFAKSRQPTYLRFRTVLAQEVAANGDGTAAVQFARRCPVVWPQHAHGSLFPGDNTTNPGVVGHKFESVEQIVEFIALELINVADRLVEFERHRDSGVEGQVELSDLERRFGYSNWLAIQFLESLPNSSQKRRAFLDALKSAKTNSLHFWPVVQRYNVSSAGMAAGDVADWIAHQPWPPPARGLMSLLLDPTPCVAVDELVVALRLATALPAVDRWVVLLRACQVGVVHAAMTFGDNKALHELLRRVPSVEAVRLLSIANGETVPPLSDVSPLERQLLNLVGRGRPADGELPQVLLEAIRGLNAPSSTEAAGWLAVLNRQAVVAAGLRDGPLLSALAGQVSAFTERRAEMALQWFRLVSHPALDVAVPHANFGRLARIAEAPAHIQSQLPELMDAALNGCAEVLIRSLPESDAAIVRAMRIDAGIQLEEPAAIAWAASFIADFPWMARRLPLRELLNLIPDSASETPEEAVVRSIVCDVALRNGLPAEDVRNDSFEDVLETANERRPSCVVPALEGRLPANVVRYFLAFLCIPEIMDTVPVGSTTTDLLQERIEVLAHLQRITPNQRADIEQEIKRIAMTIAARTAMASLEHQRIYVDTAGLKARLKNSLADDYERYMRFRGVDRHGDSLGSMLKMLQDAFPEYAVLNVADLKRTLSSEADRALYKLLREVRHEFSVGHEFGLDGYLSGGIRHGVLESHLRGPLTARDLLGLFHRDRGFTEPKFARALERLLPASAANDDLVAAFRQLATDFQAVVDEVLGEWIRIELEPGTSKAFFALQLSIADVRFFEGRIATATDVDDFLDRSVDYWWQRVDEGLTIGRARILGELRESLRGLLRRFYDTVRALGGPLVEEVLQNFVGPVFGDMDAAVDQLADWFQRAEVAEANPVDVEVAVGVAATSVHAINSSMSFSWTEVKIEQGATLTRSQLKHWVDILHELLRNAAAAAHSDNCELCVRIDMDESLERITFGNRILRPAGDYTVDDQRISEAQQRIADPAAIEKRAAEGNSGLVKVLWWARVALRRPGATVEIHRENEWVWVNVNMPVGVAR